MRNIIFFIAIAVLNIYGTGCNHQPKNENVPSVLSDSSLLNRFCGNWIHHNESGFILIDMEDTQNITFYRYLNAQIAYGERNEEYLYWFYKSKGNIKGIHQKGFSIQTDNMRFDMILRNDTLFLWDETGLSNPFLRLKSTVGR